MRVIVTAVMTEVRMPRPNETAKPDDAALLDLLAIWAPSEATRRRILVENPEELYGFAKAA